MSAWTGPPVQAGGGLLRGALAHRRRSEAIYFFFTGLLVAALNSVWGIEMLHKTGQWRDLLYVVLLPLLIGPLSLLGWIGADLMEARGGSRNLRLVLGLVASSTVAVLVLPPLLATLGLDPSRELRLDGRVLQIPAWTEQVSNWLDVTLYSGLTFVLLELRRRRRRARQGLAAALTEQAQLSHRLLESRLAAMQAQVEPQFLFDSLVAVQTAYARDPAAGADAMDRLIHYLRVALPRLREEGSTLQAEIDLLDAFVAVVAASHGGRPPLALAVAPGLSALRFYPMLLLPLVQRALRAATPEELPERIALTAARDGADLVLHLHIAAAAGCADDGELARIRERLAALYAGAATLDCHALPQAHAFTLRVPAHAELASPTSPLH